MEFIFPLRRQSQHVVYSKKKKKKKGRRGWGRVPRLGKYSRHVFAAKRLISSFRYKSREASNNGSRVVERILASIAATKRAIPVVRRVHKRKLAADAWNRGTRAFFHVSREKPDTGTPRDIDRWFTG